MAVPEIRTKRETPAAVTIDGSMQVGVVGIDSRVENGNRYPSAIHRHVLEKQQLTNTFHRLLAGKRKRERLALAPSF